MATEVHRLCTDDRYWREQSKLISSSTAMFTMHKYAKQWKNFLEEQVLR